MDQTNNINSLPAEDVKKLNSVIAKKVAIRITTAVVIYVGVEVAARVITAKLDAKAAAKNHILN